jgi:hypothetical protein
VDSPISARDRQRLAVLPPGVSLEFFFTTQQQSAGKSAAEVLRNRPQRHKRGNHPEFVCNPPWCKGSDAHRARDGHFGRG